MLHRTYQLFAMTALAASLTACGSGGGDSSAPAPTPAPSPAPIPVPIPTENPDSVLANPAVMIATGQTSKTINLSGCKRVADNQPISSASLLIQGNGDMLFFGALPSAPVTQLAFLNIVDTNQRQLLVRAGSAAINAEFGLFTATKRMDLGTVDTPSFVYSEPIVKIYRCDPGPSVALTIEQPLGSGRIVNNIVTGSSSTVTLTPSGSAAANYTQTGSIVSWDTGRTATFARFASFNLETAQLAQGASLAASTHTPVALALPTSGSSAAAEYMEYLNPNGNKEITLRYDNISMRYTRIASDNSRILRFTSLP